MSLNSRYDFVLLFDVKDGNPNGDPDAGNLPRMDPETGHGLVTDVAIKRKVRNFIGLTQDQSEIEPKAGEPRFEIYVRERAVLNLQHKRAYSALNINADVSAEDEASTEGAAAKKKSAKKSGKATDADVDSARKWMCQNFYDVRTFGAVMSTGLNCGQVRGPVQLTFGRSVEPIVTSEHSLTVCAARKEDKPIDEQIGIQGRKHTVPYGVYVVHGFVSAFLAKQTGFSKADLKLLWAALEKMFWNDQSAARPRMGTRGLYVFEHESELGNAHANDLFKRIAVKRKDGTDIARDWSDYEVHINENNMPQGVKLLKLYVPEVLEVA